MDICLSINQDSGFEFLCKTDNTHVIEWTGQSKCFPMNRVADFYRLFGPFVSKDQDFADLDFTWLLEKQKTARDQNFCGNISVEEVHTLNRDISKIYSELFSTQVAVSNESHRLWIFSQPRIMKVCWDTLNYLYTNIVYGCILVDPLEINVWKVLRGNYACLAEAAISYATRTY